MMRRPALADLPLQDTTGNSGLGLRRSEMYIGTVRLKSVREPSGAQCYFVENTENKAHISLLTELEDAFSIPVYIDARAEGSPILKEHGITTPLSEPRGCLLPSVAY